MSSVKEVYTYGLSYYFFPFWHASQHLIISIIHLTTPFRFISNPNHFLLQTSKPQLGQSQTTTTTRTMSTTADASPPQPNPKPPQLNRDFLHHLETYLAKRDGVDKLLKISRYATKIILASSTFSSTSPIHNRLKSFESSVGLSRKAFRLGKFIQDINALRSTTTGSDLLLSIIAYGGEGVYYFVEQFVWLAKSGLIDPKHSKNLQMISAWSEFIGYLGSISLKIRDLRILNQEELCLISSIEISETRGNKCVEEKMKLKKVREKMMLKRLSTIQDVADGLMALADIRDGKGWYSKPMVVASAGLLSALISTHKNWVSCWEWRLQVSLNMKITRKGSNLPVE